MDAQKIIDILFEGKTEKEIEWTVNYFREEMWNLLNIRLMDKAKAKDSSISWKQISLPNAKESNEYSQKVEMPAGVKLVEIEGLCLEQHGLSISIAEDKHSFTVAGVPCLDYFRQGDKTPSSVFDITYKYQFEDMEMPNDRPILERKVSLIINQDPKKLWKDFPVDWKSMPEPKYQKEDTDKQYVKVECLPDGTPQKDMVAASKRGRSHAQEAKPRDDHFELAYMESGWYVMVVADGAGSAKFSREGSRIACNVVVDYCKQQLANNPDFEAAIARYNSHTSETENEVRKEMGDYIYNIVGNAAFKAHKSINAEAAEKKQPAKYYATTLLMTICKKFDFGWFVASFWVGDGAICLYDKVSHTNKILGVPDEGEYAGQTRFLTMPEIFKDASAIYKRLRFSIVDDFTALFLMTDGVSDPKFETDANLENVDKWDELWNDLKENGVELTDDNEAAKDQLLSWLDFWSPGNHDDRTIAILYAEEPKDVKPIQEGEAAEKADKPETKAAESIQEVVTANVDGSEAKALDVKQETTEKAEEPETKAAESTQEVAAGNVEGSEAKASDVKQEATEKAEEPETKAAESTQEGKATDIVVVAYVEEKTVIVTETETEIIL